jgi:hypothetical protein
MSEEIIKVLDYICGKLGLAIDWTAENVMPQVIDIFSRYRIYEIVRNSMCLALCFGMVVVFFMLWKKAINCHKVCKQERKSNFWWNYSSSYDDAMIDLPTILLAIITFIAVILFLCIVCDCTNSIMQWTFVPEVKILEMLKGYVQ